MHWSWGPWLPLTSHLYTLFHPLLGFSLDVSSTWGVLPPVSQVINFYTYLISFLECCILSEVCLCNQPSLWPHLGAPNLCIPNEFFFIIPLSDELCLTLIENSLRLYLGTYLLRTCQFSSFLLLLNEFLSIIIVRSQPIPGCQLKSWTWVVKNVACFFKFMFLKPVILWKNLLN